MRLCEIEVSTKVPVGLIYQVMERAGFEEGSFDILLVDFSDSKKYFCDIPTDLDSSEFQFSLKKLEPELKALTDYFEQENLDVILSITGSESKKKQIDTNTACPGVVVVSSEDHTPKGDTLINSGALQLALNVLRRAGKHEVANEVEKSARRI